MKRILLCTLMLLAMCLSLPIAAQNIFLKVGGGLATHYGHARAVGAYKIGVGYEYEFNQKLTFAPSLVFYGKGWKDPNSQVFIYDDNGQQRFDEETGQPLTGIMSRSTSAGYFELPLVFNYYFRMGEGKYIVAGLGPYIACGVAGKQKTKGDGTQQGGSKLYYDRNTFSVPGARRFDAGIQALAGYQFPNGITLGVEADFGLVPFTSGGGRNLSGLVSLSYRFSRNED